jgi:hypothetical protein
LDNNTFDADAELKFELLLPGRQSMNAARLQQLRFSSMDRTPKFSPEIGFRKS